MGRRIYFEEDEGGDSGGSSGFSSSDSLGNSSSSNFSFGSSSELGEPPKASLGIVRQFITPSSYMCPDCKTVLTANTCYNCGKNNTYKNMKKTKVKIWPKGKSQL